MQAGRHAELADELAEWQNDVSQGGIGPRVVLVAVPPGWGRSTLLGQLREDVESAVARGDALATLLAWADGRALGREPVGWQAEKLRECLAEAVADLRGFLTGKTRHPIGELLELL